VGSVDTYYIKKFGVIATDSAGNPVKNKEISFKITPIRYYKGTLAVFGDSWNYSDGTTTPMTVTNPLTGNTEIINVPKSVDPISCVSEDFNNNGKLDSGEDLNGNNTLEPTHDATVTGSGVTDVNGKIVVEVVYPKNTAWWSDQRIESTITANGTEFKEYTDFNLPVLLADVEGKDKVPPNVHSPYGRVQDCTNPN
jgi:hypothetical protein